MPKTNEKPTSFADIITAIDSKVVQTEQYKNASAALDNMLVFAGVKSKGMVLLGDSGLGKSTVLNKFVERNRQVLIDRVQPTLSYPVDLVPIVRIDMNAKPTIKSVCRTILIEAGHPDLSGTAAELEERIHTLIREQHLQVLAVDECQHLLKTNAGVNASTVLNFLKNLMCEQNKLVVIFAGMPNAELALDNHPEIKRRLSYQRYYMKAYNNETMADTKNFASLLLAFDELMPTLMAWPCRMCSEEMLDRILYACGGNPSYFKDLLMKVATRGWQRNKPISFEDFSEAYMSNPLNKALGGLNPFMADIAIMDKVIAEFAKKNTNGPARRKTRS